LKKRSVVISRQILQQQLHFATAGVIVIMVKDEE